VTDPFAAARFLLVAKWLTERLIGARRDELEPAAVRALPVGSRIPVVLDGVTAGTVSRAKPAVRVSVTNPLKFLAWTEEHRPGEVEVVRQVRQSFADAVKRSVKEHGGWLDTATGEVTPVPGVEVSEGDPSVRVELASGAEAAIAAAWRSGQINLAEVLALPAGGDNARAEPE
jgi:hypothetical protein